MDSANKAEFDAALSKLAELRKRPELVDRAVVAVDELMPLLEAALEESLALAAPLIPGGALIAAGARIILPLVEKRIHDWVAERTAKLQAATPQ